MSKNDELCLPIRRETIEGPAVDAFNDRKDAAPTDLRTEDQVFADARRLLDEKQGGFCVPNDLCYVLTDMVRPRRLVVLPVSAPGIISKVLR